jgi:hypothetical protein
MKLKGEMKMTKQNEFYTAIRNNDFEKFGLLLKDPCVDPSANDDEALYWAARYGYEKIVALLLADPRVDPTARNNEALRWAAHYGYEKVVALLSRSNGK